ncbi:hypothetical protein [Pararhizobium sp. IMCC21322]|nr:hypothetical protein [Pararhizobium sp. IMCC21322]
MAQRRTIEEAWRYVGKLVEDISPAECAKLLRVDHAGDIDA